MAHAGPGLCDGTAEVVVVEVKAAAVVVLLLPTVVLLLSGVSESSVWMQRVVRILAREFACVPTDCFPSHGSVPTELSCAGFLCGPA